MKLFKKILFGLAIVGFSVLQAQKIEQKAKAILDQVSANYQAKKAVYFKFTYSEGQKSQVGTFYASKDKYRFKISGNEQIFDGKKVYNINEEDQEVTIAKPTNQSDFLLPISYLEAYKKGYNVSYVGKKGGQEIVKLTPTKSNGIKQVLLYINSAKKQVEKIEQLATNNASSGIKIIEYKYNVVVTSTLFSFDKNLYKNYLITEL